VVEAGSASAFFLQKQEALTGQTGKIRPQPDDLK
jgi:hypothetical protein